MTDPTSSPAAPEPASTEPLAWQAPQLAGPTVHAPAVTPNSPAPTWPPPGQVPVFAAPDPAYGTGSAAPTPGGVTHSEPGGAYIGGQGYPPYPTTGVPAGAAPPYPPLGPGAHGGFGGYGQPGMYPVAYAPPAKTNALAIAAMVTSIVGGFLLLCYGLGGLAGVVGAILGHVARRQVRQRGEEGAGMALAGIIVGWIAAGLATLFVVLMLVFVFAISNTTPTDPTYNDYPDFDDMFRLGLSTRWS